MAPAIATIRIIHNRRGVQTSIGSNARFIARENGSLSSSAARSLTIENLQSVRDEEKSRANASALYLNSSPGRPATGVAPDRIIFHVVSTRVETRSRSDLGLLAE